MKVTCISNYKFEEAWYVDGVRISGDGITFQDVLKACGVEYQAIKQRDEDYVFPAEFGVVVVEVPVENIPVPSRKSKAIKASETDIGVANSDEVIQ